jgi:hypothetical protein
MKKIKLLVFFLAIFLGIIFECNMALGAGEGCCTTNGNPTTCQKNVAKANCSDAGKGQFFIVNDPECKSKSAATLCKLGCCTKQQGECFSYYTSKECTDKGYTFINSDYNCSGKVAQLQCSNKKDENALPGANPAGESTPGPNPGGSETSTTIEFKNPLKYDTVQGLATNILSTLQTIIVVLSIIFIVLGGIFYITSAGNEKRMTAAKGAIFASMIGLAIGIAAPSFLKEIYTIMGGTGGITPPEGLTLTQIALNFLNFLLSIVGILALIMLIIGGITFLTSAGDEDRYKTGKKIVTYAVIGIAISLAALVIVKQIASLLKQV